MSEPINLHPEHAPVTPPFRWYGGKQGLLSSILPAILARPHETYIEAFGGGAAVLLGRPPARLEVYNDLDSGLVNFWRVLRDPAQSQELHRLLELTPYSREEFAACRRWQEQAEPVEQARQWFVVAAQAFSGTNYNASWSYTSRAKDNVGRRWVNHVEILPGVTARLRKVVVEHLDWRDLFARYDGEHVLWYLDPPYLTSTRTGHGNRYRHEMTEPDHADLLAAILACQGHVVLSGYASALYDVALASWERYEVETWSHAGNVKTHTRPRRTEIIWAKPTPQQLRLPAGLFDVEATG